MLRSAGRLVFSVVIMLSVMCHAQLTENKTTKAIHERAMKVRADRGLPPQTLNESSCKIAQDWTDYMARTGNFHHGGGEQIIAWASGGTVTDCVPIWYGSSGHRAYMVSAYPKVGWGYTRAADGTMYWAGRFDGVQQPQPNPNPPPTPTPSPQPPFNNRPLLNLLWRLFR